MRLHKNLKALADGLQNEDGLQVTQNIPTAMLTTMKAGGRAALFFKPETEDELAIAIKKAERQQISWFILGAGSNLVFNDRGYNGLVIKLGDSFSIVDFIENTCRAGASAMLAKVINEACLHGLGDLTYMTGIPGTVGGAIATNAGAQGEDISKYMQSLRLITREGKQEELAKDQISFGYRSSSVKGAGVITSASFNLERADQGALTEKRRRYAIKRRQQPRGEMTAGCVFKNASNVPAGYLIDKAGLKGLQIGGAYVSEKHANFIINDGTAKASDITALIKLVQETVLARLGIQLELEIEIIGYPKGS